MPDPIHDTSRPVTVTGATGFVAGRIVKRLLEQGYSVHATVRDPDNKAKVAHLDQMANELPGSIRYFQADLTQEGAFNDAVEGCATVIHTASPFALNVKDAQRDLVDPAVNGTRNVLAAANRNDSVQRVVVTSSLAAIYSDNADCTKAPGGVLTEEVWNTTSSLEHNPYSYSKTLAEKAAWEMADAQDRWKLVVINPGFVMGPGVASRQTSESFAVNRHMADGTFKTGVPLLEFGLVDVRDVAEAHLRAAFVPSANGRNITVSETGSLLDIAKILRTEFGDTYPFPKRELPKWLVWLVGPILDGSLTRQYISLNVGHPFRADNSKSIRELGMNYAPVSKAITDMFRTMVENGEIPAR